MRTSTAERGQENHALRPPIVRLYRPRLREIDRTRRVEVEDHVRRLDRRVLHEHRGDREEQLRHQDFLTREPHHRRRHGERIAIHQRGHAIALGEPDRLPRPERRQPPPRIRLADDEIAEILLRLVGSILDAGPPVVRGDVARRCGGRGRERQLATRFVVRDDLELADSLGGRPANAELEPAEVVGDGEREREPLVEEQRSRKLDAHAKPRERLIGVGF
jgi:hypothetical protein